LKDFMHRHSLAVNRRAYNDFGFLAHSLPVQTRQIVGTMSRRQGESLKWEQGTNVPKDSRIGAFNCGS
jgi:hypothetical protein